MGSGRRRQVDPQTADGGTRDGGQKSADAPVDPESEGEPVEPRRFSARRQASMCRLALILLFGVDGWSCGP